MRKLFLSILLLASTQAFAVDGADEAAMRKYALDILTKFKWNNEPLQLSIGNLTYSSEPKELMGRQIYYGVLKGVFPTVSSKVACMIEIKHAFKSSGFVSISEKIACKN